MPSVNFALLRVRSCPARSTPPPCHLQNNLRERETKRGKRPVAEQDIQRDPSNDTVPSGRDRVWPSASACCARIGKAPAVETTCHNDRPRSCLELALRELHREWIEDSSGRLSCFHQIASLAAATPGRRARLPDWHIKTTTTAPALRMR